MMTKEQIIERAMELNFEDVGFTTAEPFGHQKDFLLENEAEFEFAIKGIDLVGGTDPKHVYPQAKTIIVIMEKYFRKSYPPQMERHFGRCYQDDDRITRDGLALRI